MAFFKKLLTKKEKKVEFLLEKNNEPQHPLEKNAKDSLYIKYNHAESKVRKILCEWNKMKVTFIQRFNSYEKTMKSEKVRVEREKRKLKEKYLMKLEELEDRFSKFKTKSILETQSLNGESNYSNLSEPIDFHSEAAGEGDMDNEEDISYSLDDFQKKTVCDKLKNEEELPEDEKSSARSSRKENESDSESEKEVEEICEEKKFEKNKAIVGEYRNIKKLSTEEFEKLVKEKQALIAVSKKYKENYEKAKKRGRFISSKYDSLVVEKKKCEDIFRRKIKELEDYKNALEKEYKSFKKQNLGRIDEAQNSGIFPFYSYLSKDGNITTPFPQSSTSSSPIQRSSAVDYLPKPYSDFNKNMKKDEEIKIEQIINKSIQKEGKITKSTQTDVANITRFTQQTTAKKTIPLIPESNEKKKEESSKSKEVHEDLGFTEIENPWKTVANSISQNPISQENTKVQIEEHNNNDRVKNVELMKSLNSENLKFQEELNILNHQKSKQSEKINDVVKFLSEKSEEMESLRTSLKKLESKNSELQKMVIQKTSIIQEKDRIISKNQELSVKEIRKKKSGKSSKIEEKKYVSKLSSELKENSRKLENLNSEITQLKTKNSEFTETRKKIIWKLESSKLKNNELRNTMEELKKKIQFLNSEITKKQSSIKVLEKEKLEFQNSSKLSQNAFFEKQKELEEKKKVMISELEREKAGRKNLQKQLELREENVSKISSDLKILEHEKKKFENDFLETSEKLEKIILEKKELEIKFSSFSEQSEQLKISIRNIKKKYDSSVMTNKKLVKSMKSLELQTLKHKESLQKSEIRRKKLHNKIEDAKGKIRVYLRCRPMSKSENERKCESVVKFPSPFTCVIEDKERSKIRHYEFSKVFDEKSRQEEVYGDTKDLVLSAIDGYNVCIFAYGQTGSGKTFTIAGEPGAIGIVNRGIEDIFKILEKRKKLYRFQVECYMVELYLDKLYDLFASKSSNKDTKYKIKKNVLGQVVVTNVVKQKIRSSKECLETYEEGLKNRHTRKTSMNDSSSRSHLVFSILIIANNPTKKTTTYGKLSLVDLAGSERIKKTNLTDSVGLKEGTAINKSLSALGNVINALSSKQKFVPYRDDKLTLLLSDSIGGTAKTLMFVCISPADYNLDETVNSLLYANRAKEIINQVQQQNETSQTKKYRMQIKLLRKELESKCENKEQYDLIMDQILSELDMKKKPNEGISLNIPGRTERSKTPQPEKKSPRNYRRSQTPLRN